MDARRADAFAFSVDDDEDNYAAEAGETELIAFRSPRPARRVALIGNYVPRKCGIATFTADLALEAIGRLAKAVGVKPGRFVAALRL